MSVLTDFLKLLKMDGETEGTKTFNIKTMLNDNWDKIEAFCKTVKGHIDDAVRHVTAAERSAWNAKETPTGAQEKADKAKQDAIALIPTSLPANGGNADTVGGYSATRLIRDDNIRTQSVNYASGANYANRAGNADALGGVPALGFYSPGNKPFVIGTYTGDGQPSRFINLGFTPSAIEIYTNYGEQSTGGAYNGGLAIQNFPCETISYKIIDITSNGFNVYFDVSGRIYTNYPSILFYYIAYR